MTIVIDRNTYDYRFVLWLARRIKLEIMDYTCNKDLTVLESYITNNYDTSVNLMSLLNKYLSSYTIQITDKYYRLVFNCNDRCGNSNITVNQIVHLFNFGNLSMKGYQIISKVLNNVVQNIENYYSIYNPNVSRKGLIF
jgi:hypothetical protein